MSHIERRQREKEETRSRILEAAREIAANEGWQAVTIRRIADKIEYTPPIVYEYFENKEDLLKGLVYSGFEIIKNQFTEASQTEPDPKRLMTKISLILLDFALEHKELFQLMFHLERPAPNETMRSIMDLMKSTMAKISGKDEKTVWELIFAFLCLCHGAISFNLRSDKNHPHLQDFHGIYLRMVERYLNSI